MLEERKLGRHRILASTYTRGPVRKQASRVFGLCLRSGGSSPKSHGVLTPIALSGVIPRLIPFSRMIFLALLFRFIDNCFTCRTSPQRLSSRKIVGSVPPIQ